MRQIKGNCYQGAIGDVELLVEPPHRAFESGGVAKSTDRIKMYRVFGDDHRNILMEPRARVVIGKDAAHALHGDTLFAYRLMPLIRTRTVRSRQRATGDFPTHKPSGAVPGLKVRGRHLQTRPTGWLRAFAGPTRRDVPWGIPR